jgi:hypothetical protein
LLYHVLEYCTVVLSTTYSSIKLEDHSTTRTPSPLASTHQPCAAMCCAANTKGRSCSRSRYRFTTPQDFVSFRFETWDLGPGTWDLGQATLQIPHTTNITHTTTHSTQHTHHTHTLLLTTFRAAAAADGSHTATMLAAEAGRQSRERESGRGHGGGDAVGRYRVLRFRTQIDTPTTVPDCNVTSDHGKSTRSKLRLYWDGISEIRWTVQHDAVRGGEIRPLYSQAIQTERKIIRLILSWRHGMLTQTDYYRYSFGLIARSLWSNYRYST